MKKLNLNIICFCALVFLALGFLSSCKKANPLIPITKKGISNLDRYKKEEPKLMTEQEKDKVKEIDNEYKQGTKNK